MWNKVSSNKHLEKLSKQEAYRKHIIALYKMKPSINIKPPTEYLFLKHKPKVQEKRREREDQIQQENNKLVEKMLHNESSIRGSQSVYIKDSLNSKVMKDKERQIDLENQRLMKRIKSVNSQYSKNILQKDAEKYDRLRTSMAHSRMNQKYDLLGDSTSDNIKRYNVSKRPKTAKI